MRKRGCVRLAFTSGITLLTIVLMMPVVPAGAEPTYDNMYKTDNFPDDCFDGGSLG